MGTIHPFGVFKVSSVEHCRNSSLKETKGTLQSPGYNSRKFCFGFVKLREHPTIEENSHH